MNRQRFEPQLRYIGCCPPNVSCESPCSAESFSCIVLACRFACEQRNSEYAKCYGDEMSCGGFRTRWCLGYCAVAVYVAAWQRHVGSASRLMVIARVAKRMLQRKAKTVSCRWKACVNFSKFFYRMTGNLFRCATSFITSFSSFPSEGSCPGTSWPRSSICGFLPQGASGVCPVPSFLLRE